jgi:hypothetical protein
LSRDIGQLNLGSYAKVVNGYNTVVTEWFNAGEILTANATELADLTEEEYRAKISQLIRNSASAEV